jgi:GNAT superfamily N-acetyltransferase
MADYTIAMESFRESYPEVERLYRMHYAQMRDRLAGAGIPLGEYNPRLDQYIAANDGGWLLTFVLRHEGQAVGYSNVYVTNDMHNGELIAQEDTIFVEPAHRNGIGRKLTKTILAELKSRGVRRAAMTSVTDLRLGKIWQRMGFRPTGDVLTYVFEGN